MCWTVCLHRSSCCFSCGHGILMGSLYLTMGKTVQGGVRIACMAEEPMLKEEWSDDGTPTMEGWTDRVRNVRDRLRKSFFGRGVPMFVLLFVLGAFFGAAARAVAERSILVGYWDYTVSPQEKSAVNLNALQQEIIDRQNEAAKNQEESGQQSAPSADNGKESPSVPIEGK